MKTTGDQCKHYHPQKADANGMEKGKRALNEAAADWALIKYQFQ